MRPLRPTPLGIKAAADRAASNSLANAALPASASHNVMYSCSVSAVPLSSEITPFGDGCHAAGGAGDKFAHLLHFLTVAISASILGSRTFAVIICGPA